MTATIPASIDEVTPAWLAEVTGLAIDEAKPEQIGVGVGVSSALYRLALTGTDVPDTVIVKLPALDEAAVFTSTVLRMYIREVGFFHELAEQSPIRVPSCFHAAVNPDTSSFVVVMEDMGSMRSVDQLHGMAITDAERAVDALASWQAQWWRKADHLVESGVAMSIGDPIYPAIIPMVFSEGWAKVTAEMEVAPCLLEVGPLFNDILGGLLSDVAQAPTTLAHGDYRADNILFAPDGSPVLLDFQLIGMGSGAYDLAYFITQSLAPEVAAEHETALFNRWVEALKAAGVPEADLDRMWEDYRKSALFCLAYPIVASRGMDLDDPRQRELVHCMNTRMARALEQLSLTDFL